MNKLLTRYALLLLSSLFAFATANAQSAACAGAGTYLNYNDYINYDRSAGGDVEIDLAGYMELGPLGRYDIYGAVINNGTIEIQNGGKLTIWGDMINNANIIVHAGGTINFYGKTWTNAPTATVTDGAPINTVPGGDVSFTAARPVIPATWVSASPCLTAYSGGNSFQNADGGNVPMDVVLRLNNPNNVVMVNTPLRVEGKLQWDVANGNIVLGNNDLVMNTNATQDGFREDRFAITNGTGHLVKENYTGNWIFPVGITNGDYTPAAINNTTANTMHVLVQDYATSASDEGLVSAASDGIDRTWNIFADIATGNALINLQHNSVTNQPAFSDGFNFVTRWGSVIPNTTGDVTYAFGMSAWQTNNGATGSIGNLSSTGVVAGSNMRSRSYTDFATAPSTPEAYFSKSSDIFHPLPVKLISFAAAAKACDVYINFSTGVENSISNFQIQHSTDGVTYTAIANIAPKGSDQNYTYVHTNAPNGRNLYRLAMIEPSGDYTRSSLAIVTVNCETKGPEYMLYPNPASDFVTLSGMTSASQIRITNTLGRLVLATSSVANTEVLDISQLAAATYIVSVIENGNIVAQLKLVKL